MMSFKYQFKRISIRVSNELVMIFFALLIFVDPWSLIYWDAIETSIENKISIYRAAIEKIVSFSFYREASRFLSKYMLKMCLKYVFLELFLSKLCVLNLVFNYNSKTHQNYIYLKKRKKKDIIWCGLTIPKYMTLTISPFVNPWKNLNYKSKPNTMITWIQWMNLYSNKLAYLKITNLEKP